jgi:hypothetical protein
MTTLILLQADILVNIYHMFPLDHPASKETYRGIKIAQYLNQLPPTQSTHPVTTHPTQSTHPVTPYPT